MVDNGWEQWGKHVLTELKRNNTDHTDIKKQLSCIEKNIAELKVKAGLWGAFGGAIPAIIGLGFVLLKGCG